MTRKTYRPTIGSISHGTLRTPDLVDSIVWELRDCRLTKVQRATVRDAQRLLSRDEPDDESLSWIYDDLCDIMDSFAPPYVRFGMSEGDGSDLGFWPCLDTLAEDRRNGDLPDAEQLPAGYRGLYVIVSDHGNVTLMERRRGGSREIWSCV